MCEKYNLHTDGSVNCINGEAGFAFILTGLNDRKVAEACMYMPDPVTPPQAELLAIMYGLRFCLSHLKPGDTLHVLTDCSDVLGYITSKFTNPKSINNLLRELVTYCQELIDKLEKSGISTTCTWTKGHSLNELNNEADKLAKHARKQKAAYVKVI